MVERAWRRGKVFAVETTKAMSEEDIADLCELFSLLQKRYHFRWSQTMNPRWVRALADDMEFGGVKPPGFIDAQGRQHVKYCSCGDSTPNVDGVCDVCREFGGG